ncbi:MAG: Platelet-activating factor acetylhydrolase plasma/intracellular isoform [Rhodocyclales bacterium]|nr:Platelet-activating factor acetylhydrolase plasma/intracellular isoform [Rhodocyclales bacterium]
MKIVAPAWRLVSLMAAVIAMAVACAPLPWASSRQATSNDPVFSQAAAAYEMIDLDWYDAKRKRAVPVRLYLPKAAVARDVPGQASTQARATDAVGVPLVVFSHGMGGSRNGYSYLADDWASHGIASLHVQHVGSDRSLWQGAAVSVLWRVQEAAGSEEAMARALDVHFALDQILASPYAMRIDKTRIAAAGHSYGANTSMLVAGANVIHDGKLLDLVDPRIKAAVLISSPPFYGEQDFMSILKTVTVPTLHITSTADVIDIPGFNSGIEDRIRVFDAMGSRSKTLAVFKGGSHSIFTDRANTGGAGLNPLVKRATGELSRLFLWEQFGGTSGTQIATSQSRQEFAAWETRNAAILESFKTLAVQLPTAGKIN